MDYRSGIERLQKSYVLNDCQIIGTLLQDRDRNCDFVLGNNYYSWFAAIGQYFRPKRILEIGTRYGYSMKAFVEGADYIMEAYDLTVFDSECDPGTPEPLKVFEDYFRNTLNIQQIRIERVNTQTIDDLGILTPVDLAHVDADHSDAGCYHDCSLAWNALRDGGVLIVDDTNPGCVRDATERFCKERNLEFTFLPTLRGCHVIQKGVL